MRHYVSCVCASLFASFSPPSNYGRHISLLLPWHLAPTVRSIVPRSTLRGPPSPLRRRVTLTEPLPRCPSKKVRSLIALLLMICQCRRISAYTFTFILFSTLGELVERGIMRRLPDGFDGNTCPYIFTWGEERPCKTWSMGSGCSPFYNTCKEGTANTRMVRYFEEDRFEIFATRDIAQDEELLHTYISLKWRECFTDLNKIVGNDQE